MTVDPGGITLDSRTRLKLQTPAAFNEASNADSAVEPAPVAPTTRMSSVPKTKLLAIELLIQGYALDDAPLWMAPSSPAAGSRCTAAPCEVATVSTVNPAESASIELATPVRRWQVALWWVATVLTLVVLDDLTFGPVFWLLSRLAGPWVAATTALVVYTAAQVFIVFRATEHDPGRVAGFFLRRLDLARRSHNVNANEQKLRSKVVGWSSALLVTPIVGGVIPPLVLWRSGWSVKGVRQIACVCAPIYAVEFATLHGLLPSLV